MVGEVSMLDPAFFALLFTGHMFRRLAAKDGFISGSTLLAGLKLRILPWKDEQWANPKVCPPALHNIGNAYAL